MRKLIVLALAMGCLGTVASVAMSATKAVKVGDNYYVRPGGVPTVTVKKGTTVKWSFEGRMGHSVTVKKGPVKFNSKIHSHGTYRKKLNTRGTYTIFCTVHGFAQKMKLVVK